MATFRKHGAGWQVQIIRKGYPRRYRTFDSKGAAKKWSLAIEAAMSKGSYKDPGLANSMTFEDALDRYEREVSVFKKGATQEKYRIRAWEKSALPKRSLGGLEAADFAAHIARRRKAKITENIIRLEIALVSHLFKKARQEWRMASLANPLEVLDWPRGSKERTRRLTTEETLKPDSLTQAFGRGRSRAHEHYLAKCKTDGIKPRPTFLVNVRLHHGRREATSRLIEKGFNVSEVSTLTGHHGAHMLKRHTRWDASDLARRLDPPATRASGGSPQRPADLLSAHLHAGIAWARCPYGPEFPR